MSALFFHRLNDAVMSGAAAAAMTGASALLHPAARARAAAWWTAVDEAAPRRVLRWVWVSTAAVTAWTLLLKTVQYRAFQLQMDTAYVVNTAANLVAGGGLACPAGGTPTVLTVHFAFFVPLLMAPVLLVWRSALPLLLLQGAALASVGPAAYLLTRRRSDSAAMGLIVMALAWAHVSFHELLVANADNAVFQPPLLLWGLVLWDGRRRAAALALWALALTTREQFPFTLAGLGAYHALASERPWRRRLLEGGAVIGACAALWFLEMRLVSSYADQLNARLYWTQYADLGASKQEVLRTVLLRPDRVLRRMFWPPAHLGPFALLLAGTAFIPLASPAAVAALLIAGAHHLLLSAYMFHEQWASYTFGPLLFAAACGSGALLGRFLKTPPRRVWLLPPALAAAALGLWYAPRTVRDIPGLRLETEAPPLLRAIPPEASVWADHAAAVHLAARPQLKGFNARMPVDRFDVMLFRPEYVLVQKVTLLAMAPYDQRRVVGFLSREGYLKAGESRSLVLLRDPSAPRGGPSPALTLPPRPDDAGRVAPALAALLDSPEARSRLADYPPDLRYAPETAEQRVLFARVLARRGLARLAAEHGRGALALRPDDPEAHANLGNALADQGDLDGAERELREALRLEPDEAMTTAYNLGNVLLRGGKAGEAAAVLEAMARGGKADARAFNSLGAAYLLSGRRREARDAFTKALEMDPSLPEARDNLKRF